MADVYHKNLLLADVAGGLSDLRTEDPSVALVDVLVILWDGDRRLAAVELTDAMDRLTAGVPDGKVSEWDNATAATIEPRPKWQRAAIRRKYT